VPGACSLRAKTLFWNFLMEKAWYFSPTSGENFPYKYFSLHSQFLIHNEVVQEEDKH